MAYSISKSVSTTSSFLHHFRLSPSSLTNLFSLISFSLVPFSRIPFSIIPFLYHSLLSHSFLLIDFSLISFFTFSSSILFIPLFLIPLSRSLLYNSPSFLPRSFSLLSMRFSSTVLIHPFPHPIISFLLIPPHPPSLSTLHPCLPHPLSSYFPSPLFLSRPLISLSDALYPYYLLTHPHSLLHYTLLYIISHYVHMLSMTFSYRSLFFLPQSLYPSPSLPPSFTSSLLLTTFPFFLSPSFPPFIPSVYPIPPPLSDLAHLFLHALL
jgi:hypothetical protein